MRDVSSPGCHVTCDRLERSEPQREHQPPFTMRSILLQQQHKIHSNPLFLLHCSTVRIFKHKSVRNLIPQYGFCLESQITWLFYFEVHLGGRAVNNSTLLQRVSVKPQTLHSTNIRFYFAHLWHTQQLKQLGTKGISQCLDSGYSAMGCGIRLAISDVRNCDTD